MRKRKGRRRGGRCRRRGYDGIGIKNIEDMTSKQKEVTSERTGQK